MEPVLNSTFRRVQSCSVTDSSSDNVFRYEDEEFGDATSADNSVLDIESGLVRVRVGVGVRVIKLGIQGQG